MPGGTQSQSGTSTTTVQAPQAVNPFLTNLYNTLFGGSGGAATTAVNTLAGIQSGQTLQSNISQLYSTLQQQGQQGYQQALSQIKEASGMSGLRFSTDTSAQTAQFANQYLQNLNLTATQMGLQEEQTQLGAATGVLGSFSQAANQYYSPGSTTTQQGKVSLPWTAGLGAIGSLFA
jgi:hypothetical protein